MKIILAVALTIGVMAGGYTVAHAINIGDFGKGNTSISRFHDDKYKTECWVYHDGYSGGLSCIPDKDLK